MPNGPFSACWSARTVDPGGLLSRSVQIRVSASHAGRVQLDEFDNVLSVSGQLQSFGVDLAPYYCPCFRNLVAAPLALGPTPFRTPKL